MELAKELSRLVGRGASVRILRAGERNRTISVTNGLLPGKQNFDVDYVAYEEAITGLVDWLIQEMRDGASLTLHIDFRGRQWAEFRRRGLSLVPRSRLALPDRHIQRLRDALNEKAAATVEPARTEVAA